MKIDTLKIAEKYTKKMGYDSVRIAGSKEGYDYFHIFQKSSLGHKIGLPHIIKVSDIGKCIPVENLTERMWAVEQEVLINNL